MKNNENQYSISDNVIASVILKFINLMKLTVFGHFFTYNKGNFHSSLIYPIMEFTNSENDIHTDFWKKYISLFPYLVEIVYPIAGTQHPWRD